MDFSITFRISDDASGVISNFAEISTDSGDDCDSTPDVIVSNDTLTDDAIGARCDTNIYDEDDHDIETIEVEDPVYDLALRKTLSSATPGPFNRGDLVTFDIEIRNQGNLPYYDIEITDYIPE